MGKTHSAPQIVQELVDRFQEHEETYRRGDYNETQLRRDFLDPFFEALGWDIHNRQSFAEAYRDVIHEDALRVEKTVKAPDYCFRIGGVRKFFVEAKKPSVDIKQNTAPAFQLRRYAWTAKLPLSILTDFEEFAVYDCRVKPDKDDKASTARVSYIPYTEYVSRWDEIAGIFSKEAILRGSFDKFAESNKKKRGTAEVDAAFLEEIESWRFELARNIAARNAELSQRDLNFAVQRIIDRIVFLRICEDRAIEDYGKLQGLRNGIGVYKRLVQLFRSADDRYNSGLFQFEVEPDRSEGPDDITPGLAVDDKPLKDILGRLYYPDSPYEFAVLPAEILGQVYEQFLGKIIWLTAGHRAVVEEKPEVRKAGGVYYTPAYIVDYIVKNTVGKLVEGKTPQEVGGLTETWKASKTRRPITVLDPACGSGSFLLGAYQFLLDWYRDRYIEDGPQKHATGREPRLYQHGGGHWRLTTAERKRILLSHIYGVDIDTQAVEVTKLSLLLKVLEGESEQTIEHQRRMFHERALPDLGSNIKCGNSLIGPDFYENRQMRLLDEDERLRINVFDWSGKDGFKEIMKAGGFDAVIGNPPYIRMEAFKELKEYLRNNYSVHDERTDLYAYFIEREHTLLAPHGRFGMIVSNKFLKSNYGRKVRDFVKNNARIERIVDLAGLPVFAGATVRTIVLITEKSNGGAPSRYSPPLEIQSFSAVASQSVTLESVADLIAYDIPASAFAAGEWTLSKPHLVKLVAKMCVGSVSLKEFTEGAICRGIVSGLTEAFVLSAEQRRQLLRANPAAKQIIQPFLQGRSVRRYSIEARSEFLIYTPHGIDMSPYPAVLEHLRAFRKKLEQRATRQAWYELQQPQFAYKRWIESPKIVFPDIATSCRFTLDVHGHFGANTVYFVPSDNLLLLGLLNSKLAFFYFKQVCAALEGPGEAYLRFFGQYLEGFPVKLPVGKKQEVQMSSLVQQMLDLNKRLGEVKGEHEKTALRRQIEATDKQIDALVYQLYGLTAEEIQLVEHSTA